MHKTVAIYKLIQSCGLNTLLDFINYTLFIFFEKSLLHSFLKPNNKKEYYDIVLLLN